jgi:hypothetical protein
VRGQGFSCIRLKLTGRPELVLGLVISRTLAYCKNPGGSCSKGRVLEPSSEDMSTRRKEVALDENEKPYKTLRRPIISTFSLRV